jgi:hypothetical protein
VGWFPFKDSGGPGVTTGSTRLLLEAFTRCRPCLEGCVVRAARISELLLEFACTACAVTAAVVQRLVRQSFFDITNTCFSSGNIGFAPLQLALRSPPCIRAVGPGRRCPLRGGTLRRPSFR